MSEEIITIKEWEISKTDLYHEDHPLHFLVLNEEEIFEEAYDQYIGKLEE